MANITAPPTYNGEANFDGNMVIVLAALLCALLCALGLNSIVRCFLRCSTTREEAATGVVEKAASSRIPAVVYAAALHTPATDCPICLGDFVEGEDVRFFPRCNHGFHVKCIDKWLVLHSSCPTCRQPLLEHVIIQIN